MSDELMPQNNIPKVNDDEYTTRALNALEKAVPDTIDMMGEAVVDYTKNCFFFQCKTSKIHKKNTEFKPCIH